MKVKQQHLIKTVRYELQVEETSANLLENKELISFHETRVKELLDTILSSYSEEGMLRKFDHIELDLGTVNPSNVEDEMLTKIEDALVLFLTKNTNSNLENTKSTAIEKIEQLEYFLLFGHFSWNIINSQTPDLLLSNLLLTNTDAVQKLLIRLTTNNNAKKRLAFQFSNKTIEKLIKQILGEKGNILIEENNNLGIIDLNNKLLTDLFKNLDNLNIMEGLSNNNLKTTSDPLFITNAGLIIIAPFLEKLFHECGLLHDGSFKNEDSTFKAIQLLAYIGSGKEIVSEHLLVIHKVLCGLNITDPIDTSIILSEKEKETSNGMLSAIIQHWNALGETSIDSLRASFLQRDGKLEEDEDVFFLTVENKSFDMLLDQIPWNTNKIKLSWMQKTLDVTWR